MEIEKLREMIDALNQLRGKKILEDSEVVYDISNTRLGDELEDIGIKNAEQIISLFMESSSISSLNLFTATVGDFKNKYKLLFGGTDDSLEYDPISECKLLPIRRYVNQIFDLNILFVKWTDCFKGKDIKKSIAQINYLIQANKRFIVFVRKLQR